MLGMVKSPVLILAGEDDPVCPLPTAEDLYSRLPAATTRLLRLPGARHTIFRDRPDIAFPAVEDFIRSITNVEPADSPVD
jgi:pimeloyl-ACP methyl ester carboxylesterase